MDIPKIRAYLKELEAGTLAPEEKEWIIRFMENATEEELAAIFPEHEWDQQLPAAVAPGEMDRVYEGIAPHITTSPAKVVRVWWQRPWAKVAGAAAILIAAGTTLMQLNQHHQQTAKMKANASIAWKTVTTAGGQRLIIHLPDSSEVYVNGSSKVMFPETFAENIREVRLIEGEMFVEVAKDPEKPFHVTTGDVTIKVLGTSFNVRNYTIEQHADVSVKTGKVAVQDVLLLPGNKATFEKSSGKLVLAPVKSGFIGGWIKNDLVFNEMLLKDVFRNLKYNYGLEFQVRDSSILNKHVRATFRHKSKEEIMSLLSKMARFKYQMKDSLVTIY